MGTNQGNFTGSGPISDQGVGGAISVVFDPAGGKTSFRFPITLGAGYTSLKGDAGPIAGTFSSPARSGHAGNAEATYKSDQPTLYLALAPQWDTGSVRWAPFTFVSAGLNKTTNTPIVRDLTTGETASTSYTSVNNAVFGAGLELKYLPWNLSFSIIPKVPGNDVSLSAYTLNWSHTWGGE